MKMKQLLLTRKSGKFLGDDDERPFKRRTLNDET